MAAKKHHTKFQQGVIKRYYENREQIDEQRLSELVASLYLAEGKKRAKLWESAEELMLRLKVPKSRVERVMQANDPALLAEVVKDIVGRQV